MSRQRLGLTRFLPTARRRWVVIDAVAMLGPWPGVRRDQCRRPGRCAAQARPGASPATLRGAVQAKSLTPSILSISAQGTTAVQASAPRTLSPPATSRTPVFQWS